MRVALHVMLFFVASPSVFFGFIAADLGIVRWSVWQYAVPKLSAAVKLEEIF